MGRVAFIFWPLMRREEEGAAYGSNASPGKNTAVRSTSSLGFAWDGRILPGATDDYF